MWCKAQSQGSIGYVVTWQNQEVFKGPNSKVLSHSACNDEVPYPRNCPHQMYQVQLLLLLEVGVASLPVPGMIQEGNYVITQKPGAPHPLDSAELLSYSFCLFALFPSASPVSLHGLGLPPHGCFWP